MDEVIERAFEGRGLKKEYASLNQEESNPRRWQQVEDKVRQLEDKWNTVQFRTQLARTPEGNSMGSLVREVDQALKDMEERMCKYVNERVECGLL